MFTAVHAHFSLNAMQVRPGPMAVFWDSGQANSMTLRNRSYVQYWVYTPFNLNVKSLESFCFLELYPCVCSQVKFHFPDTAMVYYVHCMHLHSYVYWILMWLIAYLLLMSIMLWWNISWRAPKYEILDTTQVEWLLANLRNPLPIEKRRMFDTAC
jgi:hypothetical protein